MSQRHLLENIIWKALTGPHMRFTVGTTKARRYATGFSPIAGFLTVDNPDFGALAPYCVPGEQLYCDGWSGPVPASWQIHAESTMVKMAWDAPLPIEDPTIGAVRLREEHADMALELAQRMQPGPFGRRTPELGDYFGYFSGARLVAMAGERFHAGSFREISGVCTDTEFQGRGLARRLMLKLVRRQLLRGEQPFLHVMSANAHARALYQRMGFRDVLETVVRVVSLR